MLTMKTFLKACAVALVLALIHGITLGPSLGVVISSLLTAITLAIASSGMGTLPRLHRVAILTWLFWGLSYVSNLIEAAYFDILSVTAAERSVVTGLGISLLVALVMELLPVSKRKQQNCSVKIAPKLWWRIPFLAFLFFAIYLAAGIAIHPWIASFYQNRPLPSLGELFVLQFCRGFLDISCIFPVLLEWAYSRRRASWTLACVFTVLCAWGPLFLPNSFLPGPIRFVHGIEMGASGIVFGIAAGLILLKPSSRRLVDTSVADIHYLVT